jgi:DNA-binding beta-propeller fold protein YncE
MEPHDQILVDTRRERVFVPVYSQTGDGHVRVLDARTGRPLYTFAAGKAPVWMAMDAHAGRAFVINGAGTDLRVLDTRNGRLLRTVLASLHPSLLLVDEQTGRAFVPTNVGVSVLDTRSGAVLRTVAVGRGRLAGLPLLDARRGRVFAVISSLARAPLPGSVFVLDARSGAVVRRVALGGSPGGVAVDARAGRVVVLTGGLPGTINHVSILDARTGAILHTLPVGVAAHAMAVDERNGHVFVINGPGFVILPDSWAWLPSWLRRRLPFLPPPGRHSRPVPSGVTMIDPTR